MISIYNLYNHFTKSNMITINAAEVKNIVELSETNWTYVRHEKHKIIYAFILQEKIKEGVAIISLDEQEKNIINVNLMVENEEYVMFIPYTQILYNNEHIPKFRLIKTNSKCIEAFCFYELVNSDHGLIVKRYFDSKYLFRCNSCIQSYGDILTDYKYFQKRSEHYKMLIKEKALISHENYTTFIDLSHQKKITKTLKYNHHSQDIILLSGENKKNNVELSFLFEDEQLSNNQDINGVLLKYSSKLLVPLVDESNRFFYAEKGGGNVKKLFFMCI